MLEQMLSRYTITGKEQRQQALREVGRGLCKGTWPSLPYRTSCVT